MNSGKDFLLIGDRILIEPDEAKSKTHSGLYLPQGVAEKEKVQCGYIVRTGPGYILPPHTDSGEPWLDENEDARYVPLQVEEGDYAIFLRREAIEIEYDGKKYLIVHQAGILAVVRDHHPRHGL